MDITRLAIEKNRITATVLLMLLVAGVSTYLNMPRSEDPGFIVRTAFVQTLFPGASPERVELLVSDKLEKKIQEMPELRVVRSENTSGMSVIYVEIKKDLKEMRPIWDKLRRKIQDAAPQLPDGAVGPFVNDEFGDVFGVQYVLTGDGFAYRDLKQVAKALRNQLLLLDDVAKVELFGTQDERVYVEYDNSRLAEFGLSPVQLKAILEARNIIMPGGDLRLPYEQLFLEPSGNFSSIDEINRSIITLPGSDTVVRLGDLVRIRRAYVDPPVTLFRANGEPAIAFAISLREGGNIIGLGPAVAEVFDHARQDYPVGIEFELLLDQAKLVDDKVQSFVGNLYQAIGIVAAVMLVFLGLRTGLIVSSLIPMTMVTTLLIMSFMGIGLDQMSLASLIIALGMLVDNAIVMSESVIVQMQRGRSAFDAAIASAAELRVPLLVSSLTTAAAFLPIAMAKSETGEYTATLFYVVTVTLLVSWVMALTLIPLLCVAFLKVKASDASVDETSGALYRGYRWFLIGALKRPAVSVFTVLAVFAASLYAFNDIDTIFFPANDRPTFTIELETPVGAPITRTSAVAGALEDFMERELMASAASAGLVNWGAYIGAGAPKFNLSYNPKAPKPSYAILVANATDVEVIRSRLIPAVEQFVLEHFPDVNATVKPLPLGDEAWPPVSIRISGPDTAAIFEIVQQVKARLAELPGTRQITDDWGRRAKKIQYRIDETRAQLAGVTNEDVAISMQAYLSGVAATTYRERDELIPVVLRSTDDNRLDLARLNSLGVYSQLSGESVPLSQVADPVVVWEPALIKRRNRMRTVSVESLVVSGFTPFEINEAIAPWLDEQAQGWPPGFRWEFGGEAETSGIAEQSIVDQLPYGALIIVLLLIGQFNSFRRGAIILLTIPLALIGVAIGLLVTELPFGFMAMLGVISLAGIVINNAIVLIDRFGIEIDENGLSPAKAIVEACQQRLRPIILTTMTTVGGMLPLWLGGGPLWESMAVTVIFGIVFATFLTLGVVPLLYAIFFRVDFRAL